MPPTTAEPLDILDERDPLGFPFVGSLFVHGAVIALMFFGWYWMNRAKDTLGDVHPAGGPAYAVSPVHNIPIPRREAPENPVANDTQSTVPTAPAKQTAEKQPVPDKNAIEIPDKIKRQAPRPLHKQQYAQPAPANQVYSHSPQALSNPMYSTPGGAGQVGIGPNTMLGNQYGAYGELVRQRIAQAWQTNGLPHRQASPTIISFTIQRDGTIRDPRVLQGSGNPSIDNSALRAVYDASPLPAFPPQITYGSISAQFTFSLQ
ncbi:MAG: TonB family protein [Acidobacteriaceae bacterium]|nr:TonB family protein [Acidobacteriaceae bacterium]